MGETGEHLQERGTMQHVSPPLRLFTRGRKLIRLKNYYASIFRQPAV